jgi:hypothetical protein
LSGSSANPPLVRATLEKQNPTLFEKWGLDSFHITLALKGYIFDFFSAAFHGDLKVLTELSFSFKNVNLNLKGDTKTKKRAAVCPAFSANRFIDRTNFI